MAFPPIEPFTIPATHTDPVFASELAGSRVVRCVSCARARTMINTLRQQVTTTTPDTPPVCGEGSTVPSLDKTSMPEIAVVQDSLGLDYCSRPPGNETRDLNRDAKCAVVTPDKTLIRMNPG
jgi:hypothetical protein